MALPSSFGTGTVIWQVGAVTADGADADQEPEGNPLENIKVVFTCAASKLIGQDDSGDPITYIPYDQTYYTNANGVLVSSDGSIGVKLVASNNAAVNPVDFTYKVTITGAGAPISFDIYVTAGETLDLSSYVPVKTSTGVAITPLQGEPGPNSVPTEEFVLGLVSTTGDVRTEIISIAETYGSGGGVAVDLSPDPNTTALSTLHMRLAAAALLPCRVVFCGSSTTAGSGASTAANRYVNIFAEKLQAAFPSGLETEAAVINSTTAAFGTLSTDEGVHVYNAAESGTSSSSYIDSSEATAIAAVDPAAVIHMIGANDYSGGVLPATFQANLEAKIQLIEDDLTVPTVHVIASTYPRMDVSSPAYAWSEYVDAMKAAADAFPNAVFVDMTTGPTSIGLPNADPLGMIAADTIHPSDLGHAILAQMLANGLSIPVAAAVATAGSGGTTGQTFAAATFDTDGQLSGQTTEVGGYTWAGTSPNFAVVSGQLTIDTTGLGYVRATFDDGVSDGVFEVTCIGTPNSSADGLFIGGDGSGNGYLFCYSGAITDWRFSRITSAFTNTVLWNDNADQNIAPTVSAAGYVLRVEKTGTTFVLFIDDVEVGTVTDSTYTDGTQHGLMMYGNAQSSGRYLDNYSHKELVV